MPDDFKSFYNDILKASIAENIPEVIRQGYEFLNCLSFDDSKELYLVRSKQGGVKGILRVTKGETSNDALAEANILHSLDHPAIPKIIGQWSESGRTFLLREYFDGLTLHALVKGQGILRAGQILDIALELCDILQYIHRRNPPLIHRDIKPENIILTKDGSVKLIDFGIARQFSAGSTKDTQIIGTEPYMAPEQFGSEQTDGRADIYSLGVVMIYMATGETDKSDLKKTYPMKALIPIVQKCIKKDRDQRFTSASRLKRRLLWYKNRTVKKALVLVAALVCIAATFAAALYLGREQGFQRGVDFIMDIPAEKNLPFAQEDLHQPVAFTSEHLHMAVRNALNKNQDDTISRAEVHNRIDTMRIFGSYIPRPSLDVNLIRVHKGKGAVDYAISGGWPWIDTRGDISSLDDIPNMYNLRELTLTSQSIADLGPIGKMRLEIICLADNLIGNLLPIKDMAALRELDVCQNPLRDLTPISGLRSLEKLDFSQTQVTNLKPLAGLTKLKAVSMAYCDVRDISVLAKLPALREVDVSYTRVTDLTPLVKPYNPVTVWCTGIDKKVVDKVRNMKGIVIAEDGALYGSMLTSGTFDPSYLAAAPFPTGDLDFDVPPLHFTLAVVNDLPDRHPENRLNGLPPCMLGFSFDEQFGEDSREAKKAVYRAAKLLAPDDKKYGVYSSGAYESDRWDLFFGLPEEFSIYDCILIISLPEDIVAWPLGGYETEDTERRAFTKVVME